MAGSFFWHELMTSDVPAAEAFYKKVVGWNSEPFPGSDMGYIVVKAGERGVGGIMPIPEGAKQMGAGPAWMGYIHAKNVDAETEGVRNAGGKVYREPEDIGGGVGRFSVVSDPQGAMFMLLQPEGPEQPPVAPMTLGHVGWNELYANDWEKALEFYSDRFGWTKGDSIDMGEMGTYQLFSSDKGPGGGMMNRPEGVPFPCWGFYFIVDGIDAAEARVKDNGGQVFMEPMEVPGGGWIINCVDPQGAHFSLLSSTR